MRIYPDGIILIGSIEESMSALENAYSFIYGIHLLHHQHPISTSLFTATPPYSSLSSHVRLAGSISHSLFFHDSLRSTTSQQHARWFDRSCDRTTLQSSTSQQHLCQSSPPGTLLPASTLQTHRLISLILLLDQEQVRFGPRQSAVLKHVSLSSLISLSLSRKIISLNSSVASNDMYVLVWRNWYADQTDIRVCSWQATMSESYPCFLWMIKSSCLSIEDYYVTVRQAIRSPFDIRLVSSTSSSFEM